MLLGAGKAEENPLDIFKKDRVITKKLKENLEKALTKAFIDPNNVCKTRKRGKSEQRWSEKELPSRTSNRFSENVKKAVVFLADRLP